jgi:hypothetical protein
MYSLGIHTLQFDMTVAPFSARFSTASVDPPLQFEVIATPFWRPTKPIYQGDI